MRPAGEAAGEHANADNPQTGAVVEVQGRGLNDKMAGLLPACFSWLNAGGLHRGAVTAKGHDHGCRPCSKINNVQIDEDDPVVRFLREIGLSQYTEALLQSGFDEMETLRDIEDADMVDIGIPRGHAVKLKKRLRELQGPAVEVEPPPLPESVASTRCMLPTDKMKTAVEQSWEQVQTLGSEAVAELLYRSLFELTPETMQLFPQDVRYRYRDWSADESVDESDLMRSPAMRKIFAKVVNAVGTAVAGLQDLSKLVPMLTQLGARHFTYGVKEEYFHLMGKALVRALQEALGDLFTLEVEFAWTMVYGFVSSIMISGMQAGSGRSQSIAKPMLRTGDQEISGGREIYRIERHLQKAIFGDVYAATGLTSAREFAVKVLDKEMVSRFASLHQDNQFCESPLCEVVYVEIMRGLDHVVQLEDHFGDQYYHFVVSELASGGDLLEALRLRPNGFKERQAQPLIREAAKGLLNLHQRGLAMQDVSLENMLLYVLEDGTWQVRVCDPGQAVTFEVDPRSGVEEPVRFHGFVAKDFRPPELYAKQEYLCTKVDSWCLGWSTFYLLAAQPLFLSADPTARDPDWMLFQQGKALQLFAQKLGWRNTISEQAADFILRLMHIDPCQRMSVRDALRHPWLSDGQAKHPALPHHALQRLGAPGRVPAADSQFDSSMVMKVGHTQEFHASLRKDFCTGATASFSAWDGESATKRQWNFKLEEGAALMNTSYQGAVEVKAHHFGESQVPEFGDERERKEVKTDMVGECGRGGSYCLAGPDELKLHAAHKPPHQVGSEVPTLLHKSKAIKERMALSRDKKVWAMEAQHPRRGPQERKALDAPGDRS